MGMVVPQVLRSYNNIEEDCTVCPSWCLTLRAQGHSYCPGLEHHIPQYTLHAPKVSVAPAAAGGGTEGLALPSDPSPISGGLRSTSVLSLAVPTSPPSAPGALHPCTHPEGLSPGPLQWHCEESGAWTTGSGLLRLK